MPFSNRPLSADGNGNYGGSSQRTFRSIPDFKRTPRNSNGTANGRLARPAPPEATSAENFYYLKQMNSRTPMVIVMTDGERIQGCIEWYDRSCLKVNREGAPNLLIQKRWIKYLFKKEDEQV